VLCACMQPLLVAIAVGVLGLVFALGGYAYKHWRAERFRFTMGSCLDSRLLWGHMLCGVGCCNDPCSAVS
jgi:hypothetical protein